MVSRIGPGQEMAAELDAGDSLLEMVVFTLGGNETVLRDS